MHTSQVSCNLLTKSLAGLNSHYFPLSLLLHHRHGGLHQEQHLPRLLSPPFPLSLFLSGVGRNSFANVAGSSSDCLNFKLPSLCVSAWMGIVPISVEATPKSGFQNAGPRLIKTENSFLPCLQTGREYMVAQQMLKISLPKSRGPHPKGNLI